MTRLVAVHFCPAYPNAAAAICAAAASRLASSSTMLAFCPPISAWTCTPLPAAATLTLRPTAADPVKETTSAASISAAPSSASPGTTWNRSSGRPSSSARRSAQPSACGAGLSTTALPKARAGAAFHKGMASGKFHGVISPATPRGRLRV